MRDRCAVFCAVLFLFVFGFSSCGGGGGPGTGPVDQTPPGPPDLTRVIEGDGRLVLRFNKPPDPDVAGYRIYRSTSPIDNINTCNCFLELIPATSESMEYRSRGLTNGTRYYHRVTAVDFANNEGPPSNQREGTPREILISNTAAYPRRTVSASDGSRFLVMWDTNTNIDPFHPDYDIIGVFVHPDGYLDSPPFVIAGTPGEQEENPDVAFDSNGGSYVVVWNRNTGTTSSIRVGRVLPDGTISDLQDVPVSADRNLDPRVACASAIPGCLIVWQSVTDQSRSIKYVRFQVDSTPQTLYEIPSGDIPLRISVTASPTLFLVTWSSAVEQDPFAMRVSWVGPVDSEPVRLTHRGGNQTRPIAAPISPDSPDSHFLIIWEDRRPDDPSQNDILGVTLPPSGNPSGEIPFSVGSPGKKELTALSVSASGNTGIIAWADHRDPQAAPRIYFLRLNPVAPVPLADGPETPASGSFEQSSPRVSSGQSRFLITWLDFRRTTDENNPITDIYGHALDE